MIDVQGLELPPILYGTAWKEDVTEVLVERALVAGFRGLDTANQRKHYDEAAVGRGLGRAFRAGVVAREDVFLQSKFTFVDGQDHRLPYDPAERAAVQVAQSVARSLGHLEIDGLDSLLLHGPTAPEGLGDADREAWRAMEVLVRAGRIRMLGVSNVSASQLIELIDFAQIAPVFVQNRCYAARCWDREVRAVCAAHGIVYQAFSLLTANRQVLADPRVLAIANFHGRTPAQVVFRFSQQVGMLPLTGTSHPGHMAEDLELTFDLTPTDLADLDVAGQTR